jgi:hypothetical protein
MPWPAPAEGHACVEAARSRFNGLLVGEAIAAEANEGTALMERRGRLLDGLRTVTSLR